MPLNKPYKRIIRPLNTQNPLTLILGSTVEQSPVFDHRYSDDRVNSLRAFYQIERDFLKVCEYVEPTDNNLKTFSHRLYDIILRSCTEFESNCKKILESNGYLNGNLNIVDYHKINRATRLDEYVIKYHFWDRGEKEIKPFITWEKSHVLPWYQNYNSVKHNRSTNFQLANLELAITSICAVFCILFCQYGPVVFYETGSYWGHTENSDQTFSATNGTRFTIKPSLNWKEEETYSFKWNELRKSSNPFDDFHF